MSYNPFGYSIGNTSYSSKMNEKTTQYQVCIRKAEQTRMNNGGKPSAEEAKYYQEAAAICGEIMAKNVSQRNVHTQWQNRQADAIREMEKIAAAINPPAPKPAAPAGAASVPQGKPASAPVSGTTASGFTTKNACKDVTADTIETWYQDQPKHGFDALTGMDDIIDMLMSHASSTTFSKLDEILGIKPFQSFFFYGLPGCGKTFVIEAFAHEMMEKGYKFIRLLGGDIHASLVGVAEKTVEIAFKEAIDNAPCVIFIDEIENVCVNRAAPNVEGHEKRLTVAFLEAYNILKESGQKVVFLGATNYPGMVDGAMLDRIKLVNVPLPDYDARYKYLEKVFSVLKPGQGFTLDDMTALTDGYSYRDLEHTCESIAIQIKNMAIENFGSMNDDGEYNESATDEATVNAIMTGDICVTREMFEAVQAQLPPSDKTKNREELEAFEARVRGINE